MGSSKYLIKKTKVCLNSFKNHVVFKDFNKSKLVLKVPFNLINLSNNILFLKTKYYSQIRMRSLIENLKLICKGLDNFFFVSFMIKGLGFRIRRYVNKNICFLRIELGFSHYIYYPLPSNVFFIKGKKRFLLYSNDFLLLKRLTAQLTLLRKVNVYKEKGLLISGKNFKKKGGKQQNSK